MATNSFALFQLGTLCFVLLMLMPAAHGKQARGVVVIYGTARCKSNPSRIINNATLQVTINGTMVAAGETSNSGRFALVANVTSISQLMGLGSKEAVITAPPQACGGGGIPAAATPAVRNRKLQAAAAITDLGILAVDSNIVDKIVDDIINSPSLDDLDFGEDTIVDQGPEVTDILPFIENTGLDFDYFLNMIHDFLGIPPVDY